MSERTDLKSVQLMWQDAKTYSLTSLRIQDFSKHLEPGKSEAVPTVWQPPWQQGSNNAMCSIRLSKHRGTVQPPQNFRPRISRSL